MAFNRGICSPNSQPCHTRPSTIARAKVRRWGSSTYQACDFQLSTIIAMGSGSIPRIHPCRSSNRFHSTQTCAYTSKPERIASQAYRCSSKIGRRVLRLCWVDKARSQKYAYNLVRGEKCWPIKSGRELPDKPYLGLAYLAGAYLGATIGDPRLLHYALLPGKPRALQSLISPPSSTTRLL